LLAPTRRAFLSTFGMKLLVSGMFFVVAALSLTLTACLGDKGEQQITSANQGDSTNSLCYVCHVDLRTEQITTVHLKGGITCDKCHGPSTEHMHDEMLMTKPDILFGRTEVGRMCQTCHQGHKNPEVVERFRKKWLGRARPNGRTISASSVCTDCHGTHNIVKESSSPAETEAGGDWVGLFNGVDLSNWQVSGDASWQVSRGSLIGRTIPSGVGGDLLSKEIYDDYLLAVTFRADWPSRAGIWLAWMEGAAGPRIEIFESQQPLAFTGSVLLSGKGLALANFREDLVDREGWNTISAKLEGERVVVWLNGEEIGAVRLGKTSKGRVGIHIEGGKNCTSSRLTVREVQIRRLSNPRAGSDNPPND